MKQNTGTKITDHDVGTTKEMIKKESDKWCLAMRCWIHVVQRSAGEMTRLSEGTHLYWRQVDNQTVEAFTLYKIFSHISNVSDETQDIV